MLSYTTGDLFEQDGAIAHGCNTEGVMGAGVAKVVKDRYPEAYNQYADRCAKRTFPIGGFDAYYDFVERRWVYSLATQVRRGPDARADAIALSLYNAARHGASYNVQRISLPQIGCGIGGLKWREVKPALQMVAGLTHVNFVVVTLP